MLIFLVSRFFQQAFNGVTLILMTTSERVVLYAPYVVSTCSEQEAIYCKMQNMYCL